jgi:cell wall-associated NlpC family hydrolase
MFGKILASAALLFLLVPSGNRSVAAVPDIPVNDTAGTLEQARIDSIHRIQITDSVIAIAKQSLGLPYKYGGNSEATGFDCSHFVAHAFGKLGVALPVSSVALAAEGTAVTLEQVQKGDLMFFKGRNINSDRVGHVALVIEVGPGSIKMIHSCHRGVVIDEYYDMKYYTTRFLQARRINY